MNRLLAVLGGCLLVACTGGLRKQPAAEAYDLGLPAERLAGDGRWSTVALEIRAPYWFDSLGIEYRLLYENPLKLRSYAASRWAGAPSQLLAQRLRQQLGFVSVSGRTAGACLLRIELQEFSQVFATPQQSRAVLHGQASLLDARQQMVGERLIAVESAATTADARGAVTALAAASSEFGQQLAAWLNDLEKRGRLKHCSPTAVESK
ncbi:MAG: membrane integrity-associated transporter subunit PqiC [Candidatus Accumulibacter sp.]|uniref:ABC-type transport auxiliary lipoprotein family protein n=1 Tax=Accumulibacter sp. TaxID=2053492 RepID=UPI001A5C1C9F|nr:ABC-type transport auxiliary lipoprotein family protein [Accumulibacter sp.]MBL8395438.1 membrane integrity-associated transporter subunit PqiC [Accumulibacter sp.]